MQAYLINLDRARDRRDYMLGELARLLPDLQVQRALSIDIRCPDWAPPTDWTPGRWRGDRWSLPPSDIEIFRSHMDCWERIAASGEAGLVMEDDLLFSARFPQAVATLQAARPEGIVRLEGVRRTLLLEKPQEIGNGLSLSRLRSIAPSCAAYFLAPKAASALLAAVRIHSTVDDFLFDALRTDRRTGGHGVPAYQLEPVVCVQAQFGAFADPARLPPAFLLQTKRVDSTRRRDPRYVGPLAYRVWKEVLRFRRRQALKRLQRQVTAAGGRLTEPAISADLTWV